MRKDIGKERKTLNMTHSGRRRKKWTQGRREGRAQKMHKGLMGRRLGKGDRKESCRTGAEGGQDTKENKRKDMRKTQRQKDEKLNDNGILWKYIYFSKLFFPLILNPDLGKKIAVFL